MRGGYNDDYSISIHTPTRGVTGVELLKKTVSSNFNPHSHKGSDIDSLKLLADTVISIHTPTRGVTKWAINELGLMEISIHTPTRGVTRYLQK